MNLRVLSILITFLLLNQFSFGQKIEPGKYVYEYGDNIKIIFEVLNDTSFYITEYSWKNYLFGYGNFSFAKNKLIFNFKEIPNEKLISLTVPEYIKIKEWSNINDYIIINLNVIENWEQKSLESVQINISDSNNNNIRKSIQTNDSGFTKIKISKSFLPITIKLFYVGYDHLEIPIKDPNSYELKVILKSPPGDYYKNNVIKKYNIQFIDNNVFKLENFYEYDDWFTFKKEE